MDDFGGVIGPSWRESTAWWPPEPAPPAGAPNVLVIVLDDVGYAQLGCYGSDIATPNIDALAAGGVRLSNFHTTSLCSPTRACLLTGRNHHSNAMGRVADLAVGFPGYWGRVPRRNGFMSEILAANGYVPYAVGKWHLTPEDETHMAAPRDTWPCGRGFQRWYGFHGGETHQFVPTLFQDNHAVRPPARPEDGYHLSEDLADRAIRYLGELRSVERDKPFFLYFATGACHSPHHAPAPYIDRYRGQFDAGWDAWREATFARQQALGLLPESTLLSERPPWVPAWDDLEPDDRRVAARFMECFAGFLTHADAQIGRVLAFVDELGEADDTLVVLISDNGASAEGGARGSINDSRLWNGAPASANELRRRIDELGTPTAHNNYPWGWTMAGNTPFRRWKRELHEGGVADPCIVRWPSRITSRNGNAIRHQFAHAIDVLPTVLELIGLEAPAEIADVVQAPIDGTSFAYLLGDDGATATGRHQTQYFEMFGSRGLYHDGWKAVTFKPLGPLYDDSLDPDALFEDDVWELYHVADDLSESNDVADQHPDRLKAMVELWWEQAERFDVLPLDNRPIAALLAPRRPVPDHPRYAFWPNGSIVPETVTVNIRNRSHLIVADVNVPEDRMLEGVILAMGTALGGWSFHVLGGRLRYAQNYVGRSCAVVDSDELVPPGAHRLGVAFTSPGDFTATAVLLLDGRTVGEGQIDRLTPVRHSLTGGGITCGWEQGPSVAPGYTAPFEFTGTIRRVVVDVSGEPYRDHAAEFEAIMSEQ
ncbi:MAG TPA: arylsulfatase [Acidimicrobiales bacterium]|nr:arylsulfatase [Acidimicrobiales bacterium]